MFGFIFCGFICAREVILYWDRKFGWLTATGLMQRSAALNTEEYEFKYKYYKWSSMNEGILI